jgi:hypothetical protein
MFLASLRRGCSTLSQFLQLSEPTALQAITRDKYDFLCQKLAYEDIRSTLDQSATV